MKFNNKYVRRHYGVDEWPSFEPRHYRIDAFMRRRVLRLCDRCMHHRCYDTLSKRHADATPRSWKHHRRTQWR